MNQETNDYDYDEMKDQGTGSHRERDTHQTIVYPFGRYEISVELTADNRFIGVTEVKVNKSFLSHRQKTATEGFHDVEDFYPE